MDSILIDWVRSNQQCFRWNFASGYFTQVSEWQKPNRNLICHRCTVSSLWNVWMIASHGAAFPKYVYYEFNIDRHIFSHTQPYTTNNFLINRYLQLNGDAYGLSLLVSHIDFERIYTSYGRIMICGSQSDLYQPQWSIMTFKASILAKK